MQFLRCTCELWIYKSRPDLAPPIEASLQRMFDEGNIVDALAQKLFPGAVDVMGFGQTAALSTKKAIASGAKAILQPTFHSGQLNCRGDIITKNSDGSWDIHEVKSSTQVKEEHVLDLAFQRICMEKAGLKIRKTFLLHVDNTYVKRGVIDPQKLFVREDITKQVEDALPLCRKEIPRALAVLEWDTKPGRTLLESCRDPKKCEFLSCYISEIHPDDLYSIAAGLPRERLLAFLKRGVITPAQVPPDILKELGTFEIPAHPSAKPVIAIDKKALRAELESLKFPLYFLDYETFSPAVPLFDGYRPWQCCTFQYSLHVLKTPRAKLEHFECLVDEHLDPAPFIATALASQIGKQGTVISWNMGFEATRNAELGKLVPKYAKFFADVNERMFDLMTIVKKGYYEDSRFGGSASIKNVLPVLCPELSYDALAIHEGGTASASWPVLCDVAIDPKKKAKLRADMLDYCGLDTLAMVEIWRRFAASI